MDAFHKVGFLFHFVRQLSQHVSKSRSASSFHDVLSGSHALPQRGHGRGRVMSAGHSICWEGLQFDTEEGKGMSSDRI